MPSLPKMYRVARGEKERAGEGGEGKSPRHPLPPVGTHRVKPENGKHTPLASATQRNWNPPRSLSCVPPCPTVLLQRLACSGPAWPQPRSGPTPSPESAHSTADDGLVQDVEPWGPRPGSVAICVPAHNTSLPSQLHPSSVLRPASAGSRPLCYIEPGTQRPKLFVELESPTEIRQIATLST